MQALVGKCRQSLHSIDGNHIGQHILVECEANDVLSTTRHTVALQVRTIVASSDAANAVTFHSQQ